MRTLTTEESESVQILRENVKDLHLDEEKLTNDYLVRWIRAKEGNVEEAQQMLRKSIQWRNENEIDKLLSWEPPEIYGKLYPLEICGYTEDGIPVAVIPSRFTDMNLFWELDLDEYIRYSIRNIELLIEANRKKSKNGLSTYEFIGIYDVGGFNIRSIMNRKYLTFAQEVSQKFDQNYPELLHKAYFVYTPTMFSVLFAMCKHFIPKRTLGKMEICGSNPEKIIKHLEMKIPLEVIPPRYGGFNEQFEKTAFKNCGTKSISRKVSVNGEIEIDGFIEIQVGPGHTRDFTFDVEEPRSLLKWCFKTENYDIGLKVTFCHSTNDNVSSSQENKQTILQDGKRFDSHLAKQNGSLICEQVGKYTLLFDNTFSRLRSKTLHLKVDLLKPNEIVQ